MNLCQKCRDNIREAERAATEKYFDRVNEDAFSYLDHWEEVAAPDAECAFWAHFTLIKFVEFLDWKILTNEQKNVLFDRIKTEDPRFYKKIEMLR